MAGRQLIVPNMLLLDVDIIKDQFMLSYVYFLAQGRVIQKIKQFWPGGLMNSVSVSVNQVYNSHNGVKGLC